MCALKARVGLIVPVLAIFFASSTLAQPPNNLQLDEMRITFVNVGVGLCTVIECPGSRTHQNPLPILYDCGGAAVNGAGLTRQQAVGFARTILNYYNRTPIVFVSHPDDDHYNYIADIMTANPNMNAGSIWLGSQLANYTTNPNQNSAFQNWVAAQKLAGVPVFTFERRAFGNFNPHIIINNLLGPIPQTVPMCGVAKTEILTVNDGANRDNDQSLILRITYKDFSITLTGDGTAESLANLLTNYHMNDLTTTVLSAPHHGANTDGSGSPDWARTFRPKIVVYSAGDQHNHPQCDPVDNYENVLSLRNAQPHPMQCQRGQGLLAPITQLNNYNLAQYLTRTDGSISIVTNGEEYHVRCDGTNRGNFPNPPNPNANVFPCDVQ